MGFQVGRNGVGLPLQITVDYYARTPVFFFSRGGHFPGSNLTCPKLLGPDSDAHQSPNREKVNSPVSASVAFATTKSMYRATCA